MKILNTYGFYEHNTSAEHFTLHELTFGFSLPDIAPNHFTAVPVSVGKKFIKKQLELGHQAR